MPGVSSTSIVLGFTLCPIATCSPFQNGKSMSQPVTSGRDRVRTGLPRSWAGSAVAVDGVLPS
jgi:hypothetical protein